MDQQPIHIVCASDETFVMPLAVMLKSLLLNARKSKKIIIYILSAGIQPDSKRMLIDSIKTAESEIRFVAVDLIPLQGLKTSGSGGRITIAAYFRLLIGSVLPDSIKKVIYLDADLAINEDIGELWDLPMGEHYLLAAQDQGERALYVSSPVGLSNYRELGIEPDCPYFNSGVLVIDMDRWRNDNIGQKIIEYIRQNPDHIRFWDQDGLNALLHHNWGKLDFRWNVMMQMHTNSSWDAGPVKDKATYRRVIQHPYIIHFNQIHPWTPYVNRPYKRVFFHYLDMTKWRGWRPKESLLKAMVLPLLSTHFNTKI